MFLLYCIIGIVICSLILYYMLSGKVEENRYECDENSIIKNFTFDKYLTKEYFGNCDFAVNFNTKDLFEMNIYNENGTCIFSYFIKDVKNDKKIRLGQYLTYDDDFHICLYKNSIIIFKSYEFIANKKLDFEQLYRIEVKVKLDVWNQSDDDVYCMIYNRDKRKCF